MSEKIETARLLIRPALAGDIDGFFELDSDPEVMRYVGGSPIKTKEEAGKMIRFIQDQYAENGTGRWVIIDKSNNSFAGWTGLKFIREEINKHRNFYELGYRLLPRYWGMGIATEAALASLEYGFNTLQPDIIYAMADAANKGSDNVLRKCGLNFMEQFEHEGISHNWYELPKTAWMQRKK